MSPQSLPSEFLKRLRDLEASYLKEVDPIRQSGFAGGPTRWRAEREPILEPIKVGGDLLDVGCANGYLLACLVTWARERGIALTPYGVDYSAKLIELARQRLPQYTNNFDVGNAWEWIPSRRYRYVYSVHDCVPDELLGMYVERLLGLFVAPGGLLILGAYGSHTRRIEPLDLAARLLTFGHGSRGEVVVGRPPISRFVWLAA